MNYLKNLGISLGITVLCLLTLLIFSTILSYFNVFNENVTSISKIVIPIISFFIGGILIGKKSNKQGYLEGLKLGSIIVLIMILLNILVYNALNIKTFVYYSILLISSTLGSMIGINYNHTK